MPRGTGNEQPSETVFAYAGTHRIAWDAENGDPGWIRTNDLRFRKPVRYPLRYGTSADG